MAGEIHRDYLNSEGVDDEHPSWRLNINEFRLPDRRSDHRNHSFTLTRFLRNKSAPITSSIAAMPLAKITYSTIKFDIFVHALLLDRDSCTVFTRLGGYHIGSRVCLDSD